MDWGRQGSSGRRLFGISEVTDWRKQYIRGFVNNVYAVCPVKKEEKLRKCIKKYVFPLYFFAVLH